MPGNLSRASTTQAIQTTRPTYTYADHTPPPSVHYITSQKELDDALLDFEGPYGFDCEYKALPVPGRTSLVQLSNATKILLIHLSAFKEFPETLKCLLEDPSVKKIGHYTESDGAKLRDDYGVHPKSLINLMPLARQIDADFLALHPPVRNVTLAQIVLYYLDWTLPKGPVRVSNWELNPLTKTQQEYAASDAYCAYEVYTRLMTLQSQTDPTLDPSQYAINIEPRTSPPPKPQPGKYYLVRNNPRLSNFEFDAYTLWYHGYTVSEILRTFMSAFPMQRMRGYFDGERAIIAFIVTALKKDKTLPFDPIALRDMVSSDSPSWDVYSTFIEERCPLAPADASATSTDSTPMLPGTKAGHSAASPPQRKRKASTSEGEERKEEQPPRDATPEVDGDDVAPGTAASGARTVKRSRTV